MNTRALRIHPFLMGTFLGEVYSHQSGMADPTKLSNGAVDGFPQLPPRERVLQGSIPPTKLQRYNNPVNRLRTHLFAS